MPKLTASEREELVSLRKSVRHIQDWIHNEENEKNLTLQASQWGNDVCVWITEHCDALRAEAIRNYENMEYWKKQYYRMMDRKP